MANGTEENMEGTEREESVELRARIRNRESETLEAVGHCAQVHPFRMVARNCLRLGFIREWRADNTRATRGAGPFVLEPPTDTGIAVGMSAHIPEGKIVST